MRGMDVKPIMPDEPVDQPPSSVNLFRSVPRIFILRRIART